MLRPAIVQDAGSGRVLMLAWMDDEAERLTRETGEAWFWSRSRERLWRKGETSGNTLAVEELRDDCDGDALLLRVRPAGPACHTGSLSCFAPGSLAHDRRTRRRAARRLVHDGTARRRRRRVRSQGRRGSGRADGRRARRERRARRRGGGRPRLPPLRAARGAGAGRRAGRGRASRARRCLTGV